MIGIGAANIAAGFFQGFAVSTSGSRTAVAEQSGAKSQLTGLVGAGARRRCCCCSSTRCSPTSRRPRSAAVVIAAALSLMDLARAAPLLAGAARRAACCRWSPPSASIFFGVLEGIVHRDRAGGPAVLPAQLVAARRGARARSTGVDGWHSVDGLSRRAAERARRRRLPLGGAAVLRQRRRVPRRRSATSSASASPAWVVLQCEAITDIDVTAAEHARAARRRAQRRRACTWRSSSCAAGSRTSSQRYGLFETLDRDHFYPTLEQPWPPSVSAADRTAPRRDRTNVSTRRHREATRRATRLAILLAMAMFVLVVDTSLMNVSISAVVTTSTRR